MDIKEELKENYKGYILAAVVVGVLAFVSVDSGALGAMSKFDFKGAGDAYSSYDFAKFLPSFVSSKLNVGKGKNNYTRRKLPQKIQDIAKSNVDWNAIVGNKNKKVVFYRYGNNDDFDAKVRKYVEIPAVSAKFSLRSMHDRAYLAMNSDVTYQNDFCKDLKECSDMRKRASNHAEMALFMDNCAKNTCIINSRANEYIVLRSRKADVIIEAIRQNFNW